MMSGTDQELPPSPDVVNRRVGGLSASNHVTNKSLYELAVNPEVIQLLSILAPAPGYEKTETAGVSKVSDVGLNLWILQLLAFR